jgi:AmmeMemoRadiSam system protein A
MSGTLESIERQELLRIARSTLREYLETRMIPPGKPHRKTLHEPGGAFVTLRQRAGGQLRGCIGTFAAQSPLFRCIQEMAVSAATRDPRFREVQEAELAELEIEISVLTPLRPIDSPQEVQVGTHGVAITRGPHRGVLLPQVPVEHGWDRETFLDQLCYKAGLPAGAWQDPETRLEVFTAEVFSESDPELQDL